jgi:DNA-directed RNA polymerase alpha subunit
MPESAPEATVEDDLDTINLSNRARNALTKNGITTVQKLHSLSNEDIENIPGLGQKTISEIKTFLGR